MNYKTIEDVFIYLDERKSRIESAAETYNLDFRELELHLLLNLPRIFGNNSLPTEEMFEKEIKRIAENKISKRKGYETLAEPPARTIYSPKVMRFATVDDSIAKMIHERFHYIGSYRPDSTHFGLESDDKLSTLVTVSPFDLKNIEPFLPGELSSKECRVFSRVFSFRWAPKNALTYLFRKIRQELQKTGVKAIFTYLNPNLRFTGKSYQGDNWIRFGEEESAYYAYLDGEYVTDRNLIDRFGTFEPSKLKEMLGKRYETSEMSLRPLVCFARFLDESLRKKYANDLNYKFQRPAKPEDYQSRESMGLSYK